MHRRSALRGRLVRPCPHVPDLRPPLRADPGDRPHAGQRDGLRGAARRRPGLAARRLALSTEHDPHARVRRRGPPRPYRVRLMPLGRAARRRPRPRRPGRPGHAGHRTRRRARRRAPRCTAPARRPGLRGRDLTGDPPLPRGPPRPARRPGQPGRGLRGVHPSLLRVLARPRCALAAVHCPLLHDLRRPRRHRRLEHQRLLARGDTGHRLVERADPQRPHVVLGPSAPGQSGAPELAADPVYAAVRADPDGTDVLRSSPPAPTPTRPPCDGATGATSAAYGS